MSEHLNDRLRQAIAREIKNTGTDNKVAFYNISIDSLFPPSRPGESPADLTIMLKQIKWYEYLDPQTKLLCAIGWEFMWGQGKPPQPVQATKKEVFERARKDDLDLSDEEKLLLILSQIDTDMF